ncbi:hypothetical protein EW026_g2231 [Hermanssonia centrifuga]|uniref:Alginate lyase domain-containing protein n=1 Tax=Hermanssonia centrifuga TaxID=98765 RepID=A0A4S4KPM7_9APHY|nr:hypothetical protein EW026_g2231 [Hermanssonia centrifuga]
MNPNLNYGQMQRGPNGQTGSHTGLLDLKCMAKIASGILVLRIGKAAEWTSDIDDQFVAWINKYIQWVTTASIALAEKAATNNHGSFYYNQLASLQIMANDNDGAEKTLDEYFTGIYMNQIAANGDQPLESIRTRPYHYRAYNLAAMITNARLGEYVGYHAWNKTTAAGVTIQAACDYAIAKPAGDETASELYPDVAAIASVYGDSGNKYTKYLVAAESKQYVWDANFFWNQPLTDSGFAASAPTSMSKAAGGTDGPSGTGTSTAPTGRSTVGTRPDNAALALATGSWGTWLMFYGACSVVMGASFLEFL